MSNFQRLPKNVVPKHYDIKLFIDLENEKFKGTEEILVEALENVKFIQLHSFNLIVNGYDIKVGGNDGRVVKACACRMNATDQTMTLLFDEEVPAGPVVVRLDFSADLDSTLRGLYKANYKGADGVDKVMAVTQFESNCARRCFPCWDEPALKATFNITLDVPADRVALSNMPVLNVEENPVEKRRTVQFETTPRMSTYLVAVVVGEYDYVEQRSEDATIIRVYTPVGSKEKGRYALDAAVKSLKYFTDYFQIPYPLPKLDLITVPDFSAGAMENWGLITYREMILLVDPVSTSSENKQKVAQTVAHEIAHQWFGNIVTMEWWTHLWLNEGYAEFCQNMCTSELFPEFDIWTQFITKSFQMSMTVDCLMNTHPIEVPVGPPEEVDEIFDEISYDKGQSVIRMLHRYLGGDVFRKGMIAYLNKHKYSNTFTEDLWRALEEASGKPVEKVMSVWTKCPGFPMINVESKDEENHTELTFSQTRFLLIGKKVSGTIWSVPAAIARSMSSEVKEFSIDSETATLKIEKMSDSDWVKINSGACGYYRTRYSEDLLKRLAKPIQSKTLSPIDRMNILDDLFAMVQSGNNSTPELFDLMLAFKNEDNYSVNCCLVRCFTTLTRIFSHSERLNGKISPFIIEVLSKIYQKIGFEVKDQESHLDKLLRPLVLDTLGKHGEPSVVKFARKSLADHVAGVKLIPADLRPCVYATCLRNGTLETFETLVSLYDSFNTQEEKSQVARALGATADEEILQRVVMFIMEKLRDMEKPTVLYAVNVGSPQGARAVWNFYKNNYYTFNDKFKGSELMIRLNRWISSNFVTLEDATEIKGFFSLLKPVGERGIAQNLENITVNAAWLERDSDIIAQYLDKYQKC